MKRYIALTIAVLVALSTRTHAQPQRTKDLTSATCTTAASSGCLYIDTSGLAAIGVQVSGTYVGTLVFEQTEQAGDAATFVSLTMSPADGTTAVTGPAANATGVWTASITAKQVRVRMSAYTSGTATIDAISSVTSRGGGGGSGSGGSAPLTGTGATIAADTPLINTSQTWNNAAITFTAWKQVITSTASAAASKLIDLQLPAATSIFSVNKSGAVRTSASTGSFGFTNVGQFMPGNADGRVILADTAGTSFATLYFGAQSSSFAAININGTTLTVIKGDLSANADLKAATMAPSVGITMSGTVTDPKVINSTRPTITSGFGTTPSIAATFMAGTLTFTVTVGSGGTDTTGVLAFPAANARWNCHVTDQTANIVTRQTAATTTSATFTAASAWGAGDVLIFLCAGQ